MNKIKIGFIGLGYVGLLVAICFAKKYDLVGYDISQSRVDDFDPSSIKKSIWANQIGYVPQEKIIFDESTSALDSKSEKFIQKSIESPKSKLTVIIIAHRLSTIKNVDKIHILERGQIIEEGKYLELKSNENSRRNKLINFQDL